MQREALGATPEQPIDDRAVAQFEPPAAPRFADHQLSATRGCDMIDQTGRDLLRRHARDGRAEAGGQPQHIGDSLPLRLAEAVRAGRLDHHG